MSAVKEGTPTYRNEVSPKAAYDCVSQEGISLTGQLKQVRFLSGQLIARHIGNGPEDHHRPQEAGWEKKYSEVTSPQHRDPTGYFNTSK